MDLFVDKSKLELILSLMKKILYYLFKKVFVLQDKI